MAGTPIDQVVQLQGLHVAPVTATTLLTFQTGAGDVFSLDVAPGTQPQSTATDAAQGGTSPTDSARFVTVYLGGIAAEVAYSSGVPQAGK